MINRFIEIPFRREQNMRRFSAILMAFMILFMISSVASAYPDYVASPRHVFDDGAVPQDMRLIQEFRSSFLQDYPQPSYQNISREFEDFFGGTRWWNYDQYNVVMSGLTYSNGRKSRVRVSFYREGNEPVWISYVQINGEVVYRWDHEYNALNLNDLLRDIYSLH